MKKGFIIAAGMLLCLAVIMAGCSRESEEAQGEAIQTEDIQEAANDVAEQAEEKEQELAAEDELTEEETKETEEEVIEEDTNHYGNSVGNIYNEGVFVEYEDDAYIMLNQSNQVHIIYDEENGHFLQGVKAYELSYSNGMLYGILLNENEEYNGLLMSANIEEASAGVFSDRRPQYMYVVNDLIYYSDSETHQLIRFDPKTEEELILVEEEIYYPCVYKDIIIFQLDRDNESLYCIPIAGGEMTKLNNISSYWPIVYQDRIYYQGVEDAAYTLRSMKLDGTEDKKLAAVQFSAPVVCGDKLCFVDAFHYDTVSYLDLSNQEAGVQTLDIGEKLIELLANDEEIIASGIDVTSYKLTNVGNLTCINDSLMFRTVYADESGNMFGDNAQYDFESHTVSLLPMFLNEENEQPAASAGESASGGGDASTGEQQSQTSTENTGHNYYKGLTEEQAAQADAVAAQIAESIMSNPDYTTDLQKVSAAANAVKGYCNKGTYGADANKYYRSPYGAFISGNYTCAGTARALGRVLDFMGYSWSHINENQWNHQWCVLTMDGQTGFADAMMPIAQYGTWDEYCWTDGTYAYFK